MYWAFNCYEERGVFHLEARRAMAKWLIDLHDIIQAGGVTLLLYCVQGANRTDKQRATPAHTMQRTYLLD